MSVGFFVISASFFALVQKWPLTRCWALIASNVHTVIFAGPFRVYLFIERDGVQKI